MLQSVHFLEGNRPQGARGLYIWEPRLPDLMRAKRNAKIVVNAKHVEINAEIFAKTKLVTRSIERPQINGDLIRQGPFLSLKSCLFWHSIAC